MFDDPLYVAFPKGEAPGEGAVEPGAIDESRLLLLEDGHCLKDHALSACNRPELRAEATMMGTSLHTLVQMVDNGLGQTFVPAMAIESGILDGTGIVVRPLRSNYNYRRIALAWRKSSPREEEFALLAGTLREIARELDSQDRRLTVRSAAAGGCGGRPVRGLRPRQSGLGDADGLLLVGVLRQVEAVGVHDLRPGVDEVARRTSPHCPSRHRLRRSRAAGCSTRR